MLGQGVSAELTFPGKLEAECAVTSPDSTSRLLWGTHARAPTVARRRLACSRLPWLRGWLCQARLLGPIWGFAGWDRSWRAESDGGVGGKPTQASGRRGRRTCFLSFLVL